MAAAKTSRRGRKGGGSRRAARTPAGAVRAAQKAVAALEALEAPFALIGGQAVTARTEPRFTEDVDLAVRTAGDGEAQALVFALTQRGWRLRSAIEQTAAGRLTTVRFSPPGEKDDVLVDLLFASSGIEAETVAAATPMRVLGLNGLPVAAIGHLIAMKVLSESPRRLQDRIDLQKLVAAASPADRRIAEEGVRLISARGFARKKKLAAILARYFGR